MAAEIAALKKRLEDLSKRKGKKKGGQESIDAEAELQAAEAKLKEDSESKEDQEKN